jgi:hypothetical protein
VAVLWHVLEGEARLLGLFQMPRALMCTFFKSAIKAGETPGKCGQRICAEGEDFFYFFAEPYFQSTKREWERSNWFRKQYRRETNVDELSTVYISRKLPVKELVDFVSRGFG